MSLHVEMLSVTLFRQNACLIWDDESNDAVFTDPGGNIDELLAEAQQRGLKPKAVWLTHGHLDHVAGVVELRGKMPGIRVIGPHKNDAFWLEALPQITREYKFPHSDAFVPDRWLEENDELNIGRYRFTVLHIPGHTPGHVVFYCAEVGLLIAGDVLFYESIGRTDFTGSSHEDLINNIYKKILVLPDETQVVTGHGRTTTIAHEKAHNPFL